MTDKDTPITGREPELSGSRASEEWHVLSESRETSDDHVARTVVSRRYVRGVYVIDSKGLLRFSHHEHTDTLG